MSRETLEVWDRRDGRKVLIYTDRFNEETHSKTKLKIVTKQTEVVTETEVVADEDADEGAEVPENVDVTVDSFPCEPCNKVFKRDQDLKTHNRKFHT